MKALVVIPAYNESVKLEMTAKRVYESIQSVQKFLQIDAMIADDGSTDSAPAEIAERFQFILIRNHERKGVGSMLRKAYEYGLLKNYDILITMAGNNKDNPAEFERLVRPIMDNQADFVQGSRYLPGGDFGNMPLYRRITTQFVHPAIFSAVSGKQMTDSTNGFRAFRSSFLKDSRMNMGQEWLDCYELEPYLFYYAIKLGYRVLEVPVSKIYPDKKLGYSKMIPFVSWWSILRPLFLLYLGIKK